MSVCKREFLAKHGYISPEGFHHIVWNYTTAVITELSSSVNRAAKSENRACDILFYSSPSRI